MPHFLVGVIVPKDSYNTLEKYSLPMTRLQSMILKIVLKRFVKSI